MRPNQKSGRFLALKAIVVTVILTALASCNSIKKSNSVATAYFQVNVAGRDTSFSIANQKHYDAADVTVEGTLSDTSVISFATDTLLKQTSFFVPDPKTPFSQLLNLEQIASNSLFIKYHPTKASVSGNVKIGVIFLPKR